MQGFAPHYDDIDAFILQVEGSKHWRVYPPPTQADQLARFSSADYLQSELCDAPVIDTTLHRGDMLYMPRGWVHQADAQQEHSLHLTLSTSQHNNWGEILRPALMRALDVALEERVALRKAPPRDLLYFMGTQHSDAEQQFQQSFTEQANLKAAKRAKLFEQVGACCHNERAQAAQLAQQVLTSLPEVLDAACDQVAHGGWQLTVAGRGCAYTCSAATCEEPERAGEHPQLN